MSHIDIDRTVQILVDNTTELLEAHGYAIVTEDKQLFPYFTPALAALKEGRLLVFTFAVFPVPGQFEQEVAAIQSILHESVEGNTPESDPRVSFIEKVAVVLAPDSIEEIAPAGDIHWIGIGSPGELADKLRRELAL